MGTTHYIKCYSCRKSESSDLSKSKRVKAWKEDGWVVRNGRSFCSEECEQQNGPLKMERNQNAKV